MNRSGGARGAGTLGCAIMVLGLLTGAARAAEPPPPAGLATAPVAEPGNPRVLWLESARVHGAWQGADLTRIVDEQTGASCLEWHQDPALRGKATLALPGVDLAAYDVLRFQWKYLGGGTLLQVQLGQLNWYLNKQPYRPGEWQDAWLDLTLDDDRIGKSFNAAGEPELTLIFASEPLNRADEVLGRRIRVRDLQLVKFPVRLTCDPKAVRHEADATSYRTVFPLTLTNATAAPQDVRLFLDPVRLREFTAAFTTERVALAPGATAAVGLGFAIPRERAAALPPLYFEQVPVYAMVAGEPHSLTTWYRGYVQWLAGGVVPPRVTKRPFMLAADAKARVTAAERTRWLAKADAALAVPVRAPEMRHGYPISYKCPDHGSELKLDLAEFRRHYCAKGDHFLEGKEHLDKEAGIRAHTNNSEDCRALGWAYYLTGDEKYAAKAAELLLAYAAKFPTWSYANPGATGYRTRVGHAVLGECWWIHGFNAGYDLIADAPALTAAQRATIERDFFLLDAEDIQVHRVCVNQQCEINSAAGGAALNARHWFLAARTFAGDFGLLDQVGLTFSEDGFSRENELPYHFAALLPLVQHGLVYEALGGQFFTPRVKRIFDAPIAFSPTGNPGNAPLYEIAFRAYGDPAYQFGAGDQPLANSSLPLAGRTTLRRGTAADSRYVQIMWGSSTWRGGKDLLNYLTPLNTSVTRINYGAKLPTPYLSYSTLGGNVPEVDGLTQSGLRATQVALRGGDYPAAKYAAPRALAFYPGVALTRVIAIVGDAYVIVDRLNAATPRRYSFAFYPAGAVTATPGLTFASYAAFQDEGPTYQAISTPARAPEVATWAVEYKVGKAGSARWRGWLDGAGELIQGTTWSVWNPVQVPVFLARRRAAAVTCIQVLEAGPNYPVTDVRMLPLTVDGKAVAPTDGTAVALVTATGTALVVDCDLPGTKRAGGVETTESLWVGPAPAAGEGRP